MMMAHFASVLVFEDVQTENDRILSDLLLSCTGEQAMSHLNFFGSSGDVAS